ncbi:uncharacterized protein MYCFIDRAFT_213752 [Pseudocercospora fijiensis CIRAD86]|uniref:Glyoxalase-like domain-containing protein n=1 Tax=Pseudocercospora fijiensis (strain CIRAD86) TaxID=383855 RepID=N1QBU2_PSEFD|nr:uncharacterized protein MYCFIDRAFT_213752 [Pseudocercospora fijiensis CIRAD86]EME89656.1 hypothetical protein MYCFIDRAFT_213752 [Pseudocercospora fijiensis CIRAD86]
MSKINAKLDHVVLLLPYQDIVDPPAWITDNFTVSPGGRHADNRTENKLVLFKDGTYLELIAFINDDPEKREGHWWDKSYGVVDFALTTSSEDFGELGGIKDRLSKTDTGISYTSPKVGGRKRPDGVELQWRVTFPTGTDRGSVPFWCHDVTPRDRRVPLSDAATSHPSGALGMGGILLDADPSLVSRLSNATAAILDKDLNSKDGTYELDVVHSVSNARNPSIRIRTAGSLPKKVLALSLVLQTPKSVPDIHHTIDDGEISVVFEKTTN